MGVAWVMKEIKLSCCKCHFEFFTTVANMKQDTRPSLLISLPSLSHLVYALPSIFLGVTIIPRRNNKKKFCKILGYKQGVLQEMCKWRMLFSKSGDFIYVFTK